MIKTFDNKFKTFSFKDGYFTYILAIFINFSGHDPP